MPEQKELFFLNNQNLFSNNYLEHRLPAASLWKEQGEKAGEVFDRIKKLYVAVKPLKLGSGEEAGIEENNISRLVLVKKIEEYDEQHKRTWVIHFVSAEVNTDAIRLDWEASQYQWASLEELAVLEPMIPSFRRNALEIMHKKSEKVSAPYSGAF